jgi:hypothetical protein
LNVRLPQKFLALLQFVIYLSEDATEKSEITSCQDGLIIRKNSWDEVVTDSIVGDGVGQICIRASETAKEIENKQWTSIGITFS